MSARGFYRPSKADLKLVSPDEYRAQRNAEFEDARRAYERRPWWRLNLWPFLPWILSALMWWGIIKGTPALVRWLLP